VRSPGASFLALCVVGILLLLTLAVGPDYVARRMTIEVAIGTPILRVSLPTRDLPVCVTPAFASQADDPAYFEDCTPPTLTPSPTVIPTCPDGAPLAVFLCAPKTATPTPIPPSATSTPPPPRN
jgi:hypothetical protein